jgi:hypothetical protein
MAYEPWGTPLPSLGCPFTCSHQGVPLGSNQLAKLHDLLGDVLGADFEFLDQFPRRSGFAKAVANTDGAGNYVMTTKFRSSGNACRIQA